VQSVALAGEKPNIGPKVKQYMGSLAGNQLIQPAMQSCYAIAKVCSIPLEVR